VAVAVELVGLDQVGEDQAAVQRAQELGRRRDALRVGLALVRLVDAVAGEQVEDLADRVDRDARVVELVEVGP
jgi:hypothetical protein